MSESLIGRDVFGAGMNAFAEYAVAHHGHLLDLPSGLSHGEAAPLPTALLTEYGALHDAGVRRGDTVLITAATSGIALVGIAMAKVLGAAVVIGTTRAASRRGLLVSAGVDHVIVTDGDNLGERTRQVTGGTGADVVLDHVGGHMIAASIDAVRDGGLVLSVGRLAGPSAEVDLFRLARRHATLRSVSFSLTPPEVVEGIFAGVRTDFLPAIADGRVRAVIDSTFAFGDAAAAVERLRSGDAEGKVVLSL